MPASHLRDHLGYWMRAVSNLVSGTFSQRLAERDVSVPEWVVMRLLLDGPAAPSQIAETVGMTRGAITKVVDRLARRGLVSRAGAGADSSGAAADRRFRSIRLTAAGQALVPDLAALADANDAVFFGHLAPEERAALERLLRDILAQHAAYHVPVE
jgi:DNA-binding MarR family transcriptional regulator